MVLSATAGVRDLGNMDIPGVDYPPLANAMSASLHQKSLHGRFATPITEELKAAVRLDWPFQTEAFLAAHGPMDGVELALAATVKPGDVVAVENPTSGRVFDMLDALGATALPVDFGQSGPSLGDLRRALISKPAAFIYQPSGSSPSWRSVTGEWVAEAATLLRGDLPIIEFSQVTGLYPDGLSLGGHLPDQVVHIRGYQFILGRDIAVAVVGGNTDVLDAMWLRLTYSTRSVSRILQGALASLLTDPISREQAQLLVAEAHRRHLRFTEALRRRGFAVESTHGPGIWLAVPDEHAVSTRLNQRGILVHPGRLFLAPPVHEQRIHICSTAIVDDPEEIAHLVADTCRLPSVRA
jgi:DNA-binding transcriptional MocR family regulator